MKHYFKNPRQITQKEFQDLAYSLRKFGDLSGIVHDLNSDEIIGGNQRITIFGMSQDSIVIEERMDPPDEQGTVARGYFLWEGHKYTYREVRWSPEYCEEANIRANKAGGTWDFDILANQFDLPDLLKWGFKEQEFQIQDVNLNYQPDESDTKGLKQYAVLLTPEQLEVVTQCVDKLIEDGKGSDPTNPSKPGNALYWIVSNANL